MALIYRRYGIGKALAEVLERRAIPFQWQQRKGAKYASTHDSVKIITMHSNKGLEFSLVGFPGLGVTPYTEKLQKAMTVLEAM